MKKLVKRAVLVGVCGVLWGTAADVAADPLPAYRYHYVSLLGALPEGVDYFAPFKLTNDRRVYGNASTCSDTSCDTSIAVYRNGAITLLQHGNGYTANAQGVVGGSILVDPDQGIEQAALFDRLGTTLIPRRPGEYTSHVAKLTDTGIALVESTDTSFETTYYLYWFGQVTTLDLGPDVSRVHVNEAGIVAGTRSGSGGHRAFRFDPYFHTTTVLDPLPTEPESLGVGIHVTGDVLGYSFVSGHLERIGVWHGTTFHTYFVEGTPAIPTVSNALLWNGVGLIVITWTDVADQSSYIVPTPGVRINLADVSDHFPAWSSIVGVNDEGDLIGGGGSQYFNEEDTFLLERVR